MLQSCVVEPPSAESSSSLSSSSTSPSAAASPSPSSAPPSRPRHMYLAPSPQRPELWVSRSAELSALTSLLRDEAVLAVDTEFMTFPYYRQQLHILQVASADVVAAVDCYALRQSEELRSFIASLLPKTLILHSCKGDMEVFYDLCTRLQLQPRLPLHVFDTQIAAAYAGYGPMVGYARLLEAMYGVVINKSQTLTDWSKRPLSATQLEYCFGDVRHLHSMRLHLMEELRGVGRLEWAEEELRLLSQEPLYAPTAPSEAWRGVWAAKKLREHSDELSCLAELCAVREEVCRERDDSVATFMRDEHLYGLAVQQPSTMKELQQAQGMKTWVLRKHGSRLLQAIKRGRERSAEERCWLYHRLDHRRAGRLKEGLRNLLASRASTIAQQLNISAFHLAPRSDLDDLAAVSDEALQRVSSLPPHLLQPTPMISNFWGVKAELLPPSLSTQPRSVFEPRRTDAAQQLPPSAAVEGAVDEAAGQRSWTVDEEVEMLSRLRVLSGWRRQLVGNDLLAIASGRSLAYDQLTQHTNMSTPTLQQQHLHDTTTVRDAGDESRADAESEGAEEVMSVSAADGEQPSASVQSASVSMSGQRAAALQAEQVTAEALLTAWTAGLSAVERRAVWTAALWLIQRMEGVEGGGASAAAIIDPSPPLTSSHLLPSPPALSQQLVEEVKLLCSRLHDLQQRQLHSQQPSPTAPQKKRRSSRSGLGSTLATLTSDVDAATAGLQRSSDGSRTAQQSQLTEPLTPSTPLSVKQRRRAKAEAIIAGEAAASTEPNAEGGKTEEEQLQRTQAQAPASATTSRPAAASRKRRAKAVVLPTAAATFDSAVPVFAPTEVPGPLS